MNVLVSSVLCTVESDTCLRLGLGQVRGLSQAAAERIVLERERRPFAHLEDFLLRARLAKDERRALAKIGALNGLAGSRK